MPGPRINIIGLAAILLSAAFCHPPAWAVTQEKPVTGIEDMPRYTVQPAAETHLPLRIRPVKYQVVRLESDIGRVVVDDQPSRLTAVPYGRNAVALFPKAKGAAHVMVTARNGEVLMARYVIIGDSSEKYIRLHHTCGKGTVRPCEKTLVYYCPDQCYQTHVMSPGALIVQR